MITLSVAVSVLNAEKYIDRLFDCLAPQIDDDCELIFIVDSRTTDGSAERINGNSSRVKNCHCFIEEIIGSLGASRNIALSRCKGKYIWFLDADDVILKDFVKDMVSLIEGSDSDFVCCNYFISDGNVDFDDYRKDKEKILTFTNENWMDPRTREIIPISIWSKVFRREFIENNDLKFIEGLGEDIDFTYKALAVSKKICYTNKPLYVYMQNENSVCRDFNERAIRDLALYEGIVKDYKFNDRQRDSMIVRSMRAMVYLDYPLFKEKHRDIWIKGYSLKFHRTEFFIFRNFKWLYYHVAKWARSRFYYANGCLFDNSVNNRWYYRFFEDHFKKL